MSTTGKAGDLFFWFPDSWHGRNHNLTDKKTCILMVDIENNNTERKNIQLYKNVTTKNSNILNKIFKIIGNKPNSLICHLLYNLFRYKLLKIKIENEKIIYSRLILHNSYAKDFSYIAYLKMINLKKFLRNLISQTIQLIFKKNLSLKIKKILKP